MYAKRLKKKAENTVRRINLIVDIKPTNADGSEMSLLRR